MTLRTKFESLDMRILNQYEKVNQYCHKRFGTDKYDLAYYAETMSGVAMTGSGVYFMIGDYLQGSFDPISTALIPMGYILHHVSKKRNIRAREEELKMYVKNGALKTPIISANRVIDYLFTPVPILMGSSILSISITSEEALKYPNAEKSLQAFGLAILNGGIFWFAFNSGKYFKDTTFTPPAPKKNPLKVLYHSIVSRIHKPLPALEPLEKKYSSLEYQLEEVSHD